MDRIKQRLNSESSKNSVNTDTLLKIKLDGKEKLLPYNEIDEVVNVADRFNIERQKSTYYRILGTINPTMSNVLFNLSDKSKFDKYTWSGFNSIDFLDTDYPPDNDVLDSSDLTYAQSIDRNLKEINGWFGYIDPDITKSGLCNFIDMEPKRERFSFNPDISPYNRPDAQPTKNWELTITYPHSIDDTHAMVNGGLLMVDIQPVEVSTRTMVAFGLSCLHNLNIGDNVIITGTSGYDGSYVVVRTGLDNGDNKGYYFVIDKPFTANTIGQNSRMIRTFGGVQSKYYFRKFKKIKTRNSSIIETDDYETYRLAFSNNIFSDEITQFVFNEDIDVSNLVDNLGRPLSELYLTIVKTNSLNLFSNVSSGFETPFIANLNTSDVNTYLQNVPVISKIHNGGINPFPSHIPLENNVTINNTNDEFYGDLVEYNSNQVQEIILANISHRFNTRNRQTNHFLNAYTNIGINPIIMTINLGPRQEGYFYKAHHLIKIREFSSYIEQGDSFTEGIPSYAVDMGDGRFLWRDLLDIGFNESNSESLDYPFLNGCHYLYDNHCFTLKRQDPFDNWGLYYGKFPADPIGDTMTNKFTTNSEENVC